MKNYIHYFFVFSLLLMPVSYASADAWWGKGYRPPAWVLANGGSIINYEIKGGKSDRYKAMMFRDGKYVEVEFGKNATFDDAKNGVYEIKFYKCEGSCKDHETDNKKKIRGSDSRKDTIFVTARPGETTYIEFNSQTNKARATVVQALNGARRDPNTPPPPKYTPEQLIEFAALRVEGEYCEHTPEASGFVEILDFDIS